MEPHGADDGQHQVDEEEQGEREATVHFLRTSVVEFQLLQVLVEGHEATDAVEARPSAAYEVITVLLDKTTCIHTLFQADDVLATGGL